MEKHILVLLLVLSLSVTVQLAAQEQEREAVQSIETAEEGAEWLLSLYSQRDFEYGAILGERLLQEFSGEVKIDALRIIHMARADRLDEAIDDAEQLVQHHPDNKWALYAKAVALRWNEDRREESLDIIRRGLEIEPRMAELQTLHIAALNAVGDQEKAMQKADKYLENTDKPIRVKEMKAFMLNQLVSERDDIAQQDVFDYYAGLREKYPENLSAHYFAGFYHYNAGQTDKALALYARAAELSSAPSVHYRYWQALMRNDDLSREEKISKIEDGIESMMERRPETADMLFNISNIYNSMNVEEMHEKYTGMILDRYPDGPEAEWIAIQYLREFNSENRDKIQEGDQQIVAEYRQMVREFLNRPHHHNTNLKGEAYRNLFMSYRDEEAADPETLRELLEGMVEYETFNTHLVYAESPAIYAEKGGEINRALELANKGFDKLKESVDRSNEWGAFDTEADYEEALDWSAASVHSALGWIYFHANRLDEAEEHLVEAHNLFSENRSNLYRLGQLYEKLDQPENAESYYVMGVGTTGMGDNPNEDALKSLYETTRGSLDGYEEYVASVLEEDREVRKERILADRYDSPETAPNFELTDLSGDLVGSEILENRVTVINFWGKWCGPCVAEMPYIQELYENYREEEDVLIMTINNDPDIDDLRDWIADHDYTFPVLRDDGYIRSAGVSAFPTTWFLNQEGEIVFIQIGYTSELVEEFSWRVESLR